MTGDSRGGNRARLSYALRFAASLTILYLLIRSAGWSGIVAELHEVRWRWIALVYVTFGVTLLLNASLQLTLLRGLGLRITAGRVLLAKFLSSFYSLVLPGELFAGVVKWANLAAATGDRARVFIAMLANKVLLSLPPLFLGSLALTVSRPLDSKSLQWIAAGLATTLAAGITVFLHKSGGAALETLLRRVSGLLPTSLHNAARRLLDGLHELRMMSPGVYLPALGIAVVIFALSITSMTFATRAVEVTVPVIALVWTSMLLFVSRLLPISIANIGVREGVLAFALGLYGVTTAKAVLIGLIMFSSTLIVAVLGAGYQVALLAGWARWSDTHA